eukprot:Sspe_Gene.103832::Locus_79687_Transcript_1_1_Confidence_1.000_Length_434::g.103832::m.103832
MEMIEGDVLLSHGASAFHNLRPSHHLLPLSIGGYHLEPDSRQGVACALGLLLGGLVGYAVHSLLLDPSDETSFPTSNNPFRFPGRGRTTGRKSHRNPPRNRRGGRMDWLSDQPPS